ncbi:unnamed protein product, partial [Adineta steineri]
MPRPSPTDSIDTSHDLQQRLTTTTNNTSSIPATNVPLIINNHTATDNVANNNNSSLFPSTSTHLIQQHNLSTTLSDKKPSNIHLISRQQHDNSTISSNDLNISSPNSISIHRSSPIQLNNNPSSLKTITTPLMSPIQQTLRTTSNSRPLMKDKSIQCI